MSLKLPIILIKSVLLPSLLSRCGKTGRIIRLLGAGPLNPSSLTLKSALPVS